MKELKQIDQQIRELGEQLETVKGTNCGVYTRIVGYYRSVKNWNKGKRAELNERVAFKVKNESIDS